MMFGFITLLLIVIGFAGGMLNGFIASGAGVLIVPVMILFGFSNVDHASSIAVFASCWTAAFHFIPYFIRNWRDQEWISAIVLFIAGLFSGQAGVFVAQEASPIAMRLSLSFFAFLALDLLFRQQHKLDALSPEVQEMEVWIDPKRYILLFLFLGLWAGFLGGMVGSAGGLFLVPMLLVFTKIQPKQAVYLSFALMAGSSLSALWGQSVSGGLDFELGIPLAIGAVIGNYIGCELMKVSTNASLRNVLKIFLTEVGLFMLVWGVFAVQFI